jgi:hypothetical protein
MTSKSDNKVGQAKNAGWTAGRQTNSYASMRSKAEAEMRGTIIPRRESID